MATEAVKKDLFDETEDVKAKDETIEIEEEVIPPDDLKEGFIAEADPRTAMYDPLAAHKGPGEDVVKQSLDGQLTSLGRDTAKLLDAQPKHKVLLPVDKLNPDDSFVVVGTNGWNMTIKRGKPVLLPEEIITRLVKSGETPTIVP